MLETKRSKDIGIVFKTGPDIEPVKAWVPGFKGSTGF